MEEKPKLLNLFVKSANEFIIPILDSVFDAITTRIKPEVGEYSKTFMGTVDWKSPRTHVAFEIKKINREYSEKKLEQQIWHKATRDFNQKFELDVKRFENKREFYLNNGSKWKVRIVIKNMKFTYKTISENLFCKVSYKVKVFDDSFLILTIEETNNDFDLYKEVNKKIARSRFRGLSMAGVQRKNYEIPNDLYYWVDDETKKEVENGILKNLNYYTHNKRKYNLLFKNSKTLCKSIMLDILPILQTVFYIRDYNELNYMELDVDLVPDEICRTKNDIIYSKSLRSNKRTDIEGVWYEVELRKKDPSLLKRYLLKRVPRFGGIIKATPSVPSDNVILNEYGKFELLYIKNLLNDNVFNELWNDFIETVIDQIPIDGMYAGSDNLLYEMIGKIDIETKKKDFVFLLENSINFYQNITKSINDVDTKMEKTWAFFMDNIINKQISIHIIQKYFTASSYKSSQSVVLDGTYVHKWKRTKTKERNNEGLNYKPSNLLDLEDEFDYEYYYFLNPPNKNIIVNDEDIKTSNGTQSENMMWLIINEEKIEYLPVMNYTDTNLLLIYKLSHYGDGTREYTFEEKNTIKFRTKLNYVNLYLVQRSPTFYGKWEGVHLKILDSFMLKYEPMKIKMMSNEHNLGIEHKSTWLVLNSISFPVQLLEKKNIDTSGIYYLSDDLNYPTKDTLVVPVEVEIQYIDINTSKPFVKYERRKFGESTWVEDGASWYGIFSENKAGSQPYSIYYDESTNKSIFGYEQLPQKISIGDWKSFINKDKLYIGSCTKKNYDYSFDLHKRILGCFDELNTWYYFVYNTSKSSDFAVRTIKRMLEYQKEFNLMNGFLKDNVDIDKKVGLLIPTDFK